VFVDRRNVKPKKSHKKKPGKSHKKGGKASVKKGKGKAAVV
jgi:hypothetical protein